MKKLLTLFFLISLVANAQEFNLDFKQKLKFKINDKQETELVVFASPQHEFMFLEIPQLMRRIPYEMSTVLDIDSATIVGMLLDTKKLESHIVFKNTTTTPVFIDFSLKEIMELVSSKKGRRVEETIVVSKMNTHKTVQGIKCDWYSVSPEEEKDNPIQICIAKKSVDMTPLVKTLFTSMGIAIKNEDSLPKGLVIEVFYPKKDKTLLELTKAEKINKKLVYKKEFSFK